METDHWTTVATLNDKMLEHASGLPESELQTLQVLKVAEEAGEAAHAMHGVRGTATCGETHTVEGVVRELSGAIIASMIAITRLVDDPKETFEKVFTERTARART